MKLPGWGAVRVQLAGIHRRRCTGRSFAHSAHPQVSRCLPGGGGVLRDGDDPLGGKLCERYQGNFILEIVYGPAAPKAGCAVSTFAAKFVSPIEDRSKQLHELVHAHSSLPDDCSQGASVQLFVVGNYQLGEGIIPPQDYVTSHLSLEAKAFFSKTLMHSRPEITESLLIPPPVWRRADLLELGCRPPQGRRCKPRSLP